MRDIAFAKSTDAGRRFEPLVRVSEDKWELNGCPEDGPTLAVDQAGTIDIAWTTVVTEGEPLKALFYAASRDGKTFSPRARVRVDAEADAWPSTIDAHVRWRCRHCVGRGDRRSAACFVHEGIARRRLPAVQALSGDEAASNPVIVRSEGNLVVAWTSRSPTAKAASDPSVIKIRRISVG